MTSVSGRELARALEHHGWSLLRVQGSHHIYGKSGSAVRISIPIDANLPLKLGRLRHLFRQAGLTEKDV